MKPSDLLQAYHVDKGGFTPLYIQLRDILKELINGQKLLPGDQIPSENELSAAFNISRMTVRQAIQELMREGIVTIRRGEGTFVSAVPHTQMLLKLEGFSSEMAKLGYRNHSRVLSVKKISSFDSYELAYSGLGMDPGEPLVRISRIRFVEDTPFALETSFLSLKTGAGLLDPQLADNMSIYNYIEKELHVRLSRADHIIQPDLADNDTAKHLEIEPGSPILKLHGTTFSMTNKPIEYLEGVYRGDQYELKVVITK
ncbi:MAG: GntR family transcriptional regulator [Candidatus Marinimicrobia bacterium]|nr:GntR family transcriptional regulator [Candidatus Neomarinimicrobiota bacterium]MCF7904604.1 GntR family transcriptional regulator [Candidatus Neomarinimicrobiota bacterium]